MQRIRGSSFPAARTVADLRLWTEHENKDLAWLSTGSKPILYWYDSANATTDDGDNYITPDDVAGNGRWVKEDTVTLEVADGGTGATTLATAPLIGDGTNPITSLGVMANGEFLVGDGNGAPVYESDAVVRASLGLGIADDVTFNSLVIADNLVTGVQTMSGTGSTLELPTAGALLKLGHASDTLIGRTSAGQLNVSGNEIYAQGGTTVAVADGGTGETTKQAAIDSLTGLLPATTVGHVLTKSAAGNAEWEQAPGAQGGEANHGVNLPANGEGIFAGMDVNDDLTFRNVSAGLGISVSTVNDDVFISTGAQLNQGEALAGSGERVYTGMNSTTNALKFRTITASTNMGLSADTNNVYVWTSAEPNTIESASSLGGAGIYKTLTTKNLEFRGITGTGGIAVSEETNDVEISLANPEILSVLAADSSKTSVTLSAYETDLTTTLAVGVWKVDGLLTVSNAVTGVDAKVERSFTGTTGAVVNWNANYIPVTGGHYLTYGWADGAALPLDITGVAGRAAPLYISAIMEVTVAGDVRIRFAQNTGDAGNASIMRKGSYLKFTKLI